MHTVSKDTSAKAISWASIFTKSMPLRSLNASLNAGSARSFVSMPMVSA
jgi:hypothetical protein